MRYKILDEEVIDTRTGLIWRGVTEDLTYTKALEYAEHTSQETGQAWRVPTIDELASLADRSRCAPASCFPGMPARAFWSSSPFVGDTSYAWFVGFNYGVADISLRGHYYAVWLVRDNLEKLISNQEPPGYELE